METDNLNIGNIGQSYAYIMASFSTLVCIMTFLFVQSDLFV